MVLSNDAIVDRGFKACQPDFSRVTFLVWYLPSSVDIAVLTLNIEGLRITWTQSLGMSGGII